MFRTVHYAKVNHRRRLFNVSNQETMKLIQEALDAHEEAIQKSSTLPTDKLGARLQIGQREVVLRNLLYQMVAHPREHSSEIKKILAMTNGPRATEAQDIMAQARESMANFLANFTSLDDSDLDRQFEGDERTIRAILQHVKEGHRYVLNAVDKALES